MGYARAGFEVVGVDNENRRRYPFEFHQADAIEYVTEHWQDFDAIHASPPCQAYSVTRHTNDKDHPDLVEPTRDALLATGLPFIIENVEGAPLIDPLLLCGSMFGLKAIDVDGERLALQRHRLFESNVWLMSAGGCAHDGDQVAGVYGGGRHRNVSDRDSPSRRGGYTPLGSVRNELMGIDWMTQWGLTQAIPPAYTEFLGAQLLDHLTVIDPIVVTA
jgi:DNA (cytosine-5)-methyltransferase 1